MMTKKKLDLFIEALIKIRNSATDEDALVSSALYPEWKGSGITYKEGERVLYKDVLYRVLLAHTSQSDWTPDVAYSLFAKVLTGDTGDILPWEQPNSTNPYMAGDKVTHNGYTWESIIDNNVWEPGVYGWNQI
jgi:hypothetical protein